MLNKQNQHKAIRKLIHRLPMREKLRILHIAIEEYKKINPDCSIILFPKGFLESVFKEQYLKMEE